MLKRLIFSLAGSAAVVVQYGCIAYCTVEFVVDPVLCSGPSMMETIKHNDIVLTEHYSVHQRNISRGDVVICRSPANPLQFICKRVKSLPGDRIEHFPQRSFHHTGSYVPRGHVWLEGDNKDNSTDSRTYGPVPQALIRGRVFMKIWPIWDFGRIKRQEMS